MAWCGIAKKMVPPEDTARCNNAEGCDDCPHNVDEDESGDDHDFNMKFGKA